MMEELGRAFRFCNQLAGWDGSVQYPFDIPWPLDVWKQHASLLAATLNPYDWAKVATAYRMAASLEGDYGQAPAPPDRFGRQELHKLADWILDGINVLSRVAGGPPNLKEPTPDAPRHKGSFRWRRGRRASAE
jgi:hypothetical protein